MCSLFREGQRLTILMRSLTPMHYLLSLYMCSMSWICHMNLCHCTPFQCPDKDVGMIIGRGGCVIKQMQSTTRCRIQIPPTAPPGSMYRVISVIGNAAGCQQVKQMIETIVAEQSSQSVMSGVGFAAANPYGQQAAYGQQAYGQAAYGQGYYGQQQTADATGQKDYSAEWAAYYAAMGQTGAAATVTAAAPAATTTATATALAPAGEIAHDAYYEVFWQYASYYGEEAARKHYGAWSPPEGTPNPNLANGTASAPVAAAPAPVDTQASSEATTQHSQEIRDSSVRKVSNLPAWMNKS
jgi:far upstream element-binding protein